MTTAWGDDIVLWLITTAAALLGIELSQQDLSLPWDQLSKKISDANRDYLIANHPLIYLALNAIYEQGKNIAGTLPAPTGIINPATERSARDTAIDQIRDITLSRTGDDSPTYIYRSGSKSGNNLTPREKDLNRLSYYLEPPRSGTYTVTTMELINATGLLIAVQDGPNHVSIIPVDIGKLPDWIASRPNADSDPHFFTQLIQGASIQFNLR